jgi:hypothetical protein
LKYSFIPTLLLSIYTLNPVFLQNLNVGGGLSLPTYWGDLNSNNIVRDFRNNTNLGVNVKGSYQFFDQLSFGVSLNYGRMQGDDAKSIKDYQLERNLDFYTNIFETSFGLEYHPFAWRLLKTNNILIPFIQLNAGVFHVNPKTSFNSQIIELQPLGTEGQGMPGFDDRYKLWNMSGGAGGGLKFDINDQFLIVVDARLMLSSTDYIDDVARFYVNFNELRAGNGLLSAQLSDRTPEVRNLNEPLNRPTGSQRGGAAKDMYFMTNITFMYKLNILQGNRKSFNKNKVLCPKFD